VNSRCHFRGSGQRGEKAWSFSALPFEVVKISDHGTSHPVIARLHLQTFNLLNACPEALRESAKGIYFDAAFRLLRCFDAHADLQQKQNNAESEILPSSNPQVIYRPNLIDLNRLVETFLYEAKNFLRDISTVFEAFRGPKFNEAAALGKKASRWAAAKFGDDDRLTNHLQKHWPWIDHLIKMRNAVEHPGGYSGTLYIDNYRIVDNAPRKPTWHLNDYPPSEIDTEMGEFCQGLLIFSEELLALFIEKHLPSLFQIVEIPESEKNATMPTRLKVDINPDVWAARSAERGGAPSGLP
jgi:hypothetical protein